MKNKAFTLLELLVVIGIIGVMMALATVAYSTAQRSGRDARRKQDMVAIQNALEQYYSANTFAYPNPDCTVAKTYLKSGWPVDPGTNLAYSGIGSCNLTTYCLCATLDGTGGNATAANCTSWAPPSDVNSKYYCVGNLQ